MADPIPQPVAGAWRANPLADFLVYQLLCLTRATLIQHFSDDPEEGRYTAALRRETAKRRGGAAWLLQSWNKHPEHGTLRLSARPVANTFSLHVSHANFTAEVTVTYDIDVAELDTASITQFQGDLSAAIAGARFWVDALTDYGLEGLGLDKLDDLDLDDNELEDVFGDTDADDDTDKSDDATERRVVDAIARNISRRLHEGMPPDVSEEERAWLDREPWCLAAILQGAVAAATAIPRNDSLLDAWGYLVEQHLEHVRLIAERGHKWAQDLLDDYQTRLLQLAGDNALAHEDLFPLVAALGHAKVPVKPELSEALMSSGPGLPGSTSPEQALEHAVRPLIDEMARSVDSPFEVIEALAETAAVMPSAVRGFVAHELALSPHEVMREAVPLILLDGDAEVRRAAVQALEQHADTLSPASLRRVIALRNWVPEADRAAVDQVIRKARGKDMQPAQWPSGPDLVMRASPVDGSGAQSALFASRSGKAGVFAGLLLKQDFGIRDAWCHRDMPRREIASAIADVQRSIQAPEMERAYIDLAVQNSIATGVAAGNPPTPALLEIAEALRAADWQDRRIDVAAETERLFGTLAAQQRTEATITAVLQRCVEWMDQDEMAVSWFEDDAEATAAVAGMDADDETAALALLDGLLQQRRDAWGERFLLMALWARGVKPGQPSRRGAARPLAWSDFLVLAHEVVSGRPLRDNPVMLEIAERTVAAARDDV